jgi:hypothetical protein
MLRLPGGGVNPAASQVIAALFLLLVLRIMVEHLPLNQIGDAETRR